MSWPTQKASSQYLATNDDAIHKGRQPINQNIQNVNSIIDTFDFTSPTDKDIILYNSTTGKFTPSQYTNYSVFSFTPFVNNQDSINLREYTGTITKLNNNNTGVTINPDSAGRTELEFLAGTYFFEYLHHETSFRNTFQIFWKDNSDTTHFRMTRGAVGGPTGPVVAYYIQSYATFASDTTLTIQYTSLTQPGYTAADFDHRELTIYKIA